MISLEPHRRPSFIGEHLLEPPVSSINRHFLTPLSPSSCRTSPHSSMIAKAAIHRNIAVPSRPLRPVVAPPPRCVLAGFTLPGTSPSSCMSCPRRIPRTSLPGWTPPVAPARRHARGHRAVTTGARASWAGWLLSHATGRHATTCGPASPAHHRPWASLKLGTVWLFLTV
jgi:hypothetical protein